MQITDILAQTGGLQSLARELGISETDAARGAAAACWRTCSARSQPT